MRGIVPLCTFDKSYFTKCQAYFRKNEYIKLNKIYLAFHDDFWHFSPTLLTCTLTALEQKTLGQ